MNWPDVEVIKEDGIYYWNLLKNNGEFENKMNRLHIDSFLKQYNHESRYYEPIHCIFTLHDSILEAYRKIFYERWLFDTGSDTDKKIYFSLEAEKKKRLNNISHQINLQGDWLVELQPNGDFRIVYP
jgi:hypothetical protein